MTAKEKMELELSVYVRFNVFLQKFQQKLYEYTSLTNEIYWYANAAESLLIVSDSKFTSEIFRIVDDFSSERSLKYKFTKTQHNIFFKFSQR